MGVISEDYIMGLLKGYVKTEYGKALVDEHLKRSFSSGKSIGGASHENISAILRIIKMDLFYTIVSRIPSFLRSGESCLSENIGEYKDGYVNASISVDTAVLHRDSLRRRDGRGYTGGGIDDILSLFVHGYTIGRNRPWGYWVHSEPLSEDYIGAKVHRNPDNFLQEMVDDELSNRRRTLKDAKMWVNIKYRI